MRPLVRVIRAHPFAVQALVGLVMLAGAFAAVPEPPMAAPMYTGLGALLAIHLCAGHTTPQHTRWTLVWLVLVRVVFFALGPVFSDDLFRYVHEGRAMLVDVTWPYLHAPAERAFGPDGLSGAVNHPDIAAVYPPPVLALFAGLAWLGDACGAPLFVFRLAAAAAEGAVLALLWRARARVPHAWWRYATHPLPLVAATAGTHLDVYGMLVFAAASLWLLHRASSGWGAVKLGLLAGLATCVKPLGAALALAARPRWFAAAALALGVTVLAGYGPHAARGARPGAQVGMYAVRWSAHPTLHALLEHLVIGPATRAVARHGHTHAHTAPFAVETAGRARVGHFTPGAHGGRTWLSGALLARLLGAAGFLFTCAFVLRKARRPLSHVVWPIAAYMAWSPTLHPWYGLWLLVPAALLDSRALLWGSAGLLALYQTPIDRFISGAWEEALWPRIVLVCLVGLGFWQSRHNRVRPASPQPASEHDERE